VTITIHASQQEHALITTNPVERAEYSTLTFESESREKTVPLHILQEQEGDTATLKIRTNHHRQSVQHTNA
jgi:hypothetical protein